VVFDAIPVIRALKQMSFSPIDVLLQAAEATALVLRVELSYRKLRKAAFRQRS